MDDKKKQQEELKNLLKKIPERINSCGIMEVRRYKKFFVNATKAVESGLKVDIYINQSREFYSDLERIGNEKA